MRLITCIILCVIPFRLSADPIAQVAEAASAAFDRMPVIEAVDKMQGACGADDTVHPDVAYCTATNTILVSRVAERTLVSAYFVAHAFGHAVQVQHGVADVALREIRNRRDEEQMLRGWVERQVDCIAGFVMARADLALPDLPDNFAEDPLDRPHWGRNPLARGPHVPVPVTERARWLATGYQGGLSACVVGEFEAALLLGALRE